MTPEQGRPFRLLRRFLSVVGVAADAKPLLDEFFHTVRQRVGPLAPCCPSTFSAAFERKNNTRQFYLICPAPRAEELELNKGEEIEWVIEDKYHVTIRRNAPAVRKR